jgi:hypothetical protein
MTELMQLPASLTPTKENAEWDSVERRLRWPGFPFVLGEDGS